MHKTPEETAIIIAYLFKKSGQKRARISENTFRFLSSRKKIRAAFVVSVRDALDDLGITMLELDRGGFGLIPVSVLEGAPAITAKKYLSDMLTDIKRCKVNFDKLRSEVEVTNSSDDEE